MADLMTALRNADAAGDTEAANRIAAMIRNQQSEEQAATGDPQRAYSIPDEAPISPEEKAELFPRFSAGEQLLAAPETALSLATGATTGAAGYGAGSAVGALGDLAGILSPEEAQDLANRWASTLTYEPDSEASKQQLSKIGETLGVLPAVMGAGHMAGVGRASAPRGIPARAAISEAPKVAESIFKYQSPTKQKIGQLLQEGSTDADTAKYKLIGEGSARVTGDKTARETIKQGFDEGVIAAVKQASPEDKQAMLKMVDTMEKGKKNKRFAAMNRPSDVAGDTLLNRFKVITKANREAVRELDTVAKSLKGQEVDVSPAVNNFVDNLEGMGVTLDDNFKPVFKGSDIEGVTAAEEIINRMTGRMKNTRSPDAYDTHRMKKFIDENVSYGKSGEGLTGKTEGVMKKLRRDLDASLDNKLPEYDRVNTAYSETINSINQLQDVAGKKMNLTGEHADKAVGTLLRRLMSNAQSRVRLLDAVVSVEETAKKYGGGTPKNDLLSQVLFVDELDAVFGPVARTSFKGQIEQAIKKGASATQSGGLFQAVVDKAGEGAEKLRGINEEGAFKSIKELLKE